MDPGSAVVEFLVDVSLRSLGLAAAAGVAIGLLRVRSAAGRHAVWTLAAGAMLLMAVLRPVMPPLALPVLRPAPAVATAFVATAPEMAAAAPAAQPAPRPAPIGWLQVVAAVYGAGVLVFAAMLLASYGFTRRLARASRAVEGLGDGVFESDWIAVPMTVGFVRPKILLPPDWREWQPDKLDAAMAHERMHVRRADWAVAVLAGLNRCLFWFHPVAWWLARRLSALAEQACDDAALLALGRRECYAQTLLDMTAVVHRGRGRMVWEAMAMARTAEVRNRIERILDDTRQIPRGWSRARWMAVAACSVPLFYMAAAVQVTEARQAPQGPEAAAQTEPAQPAAQTKDDAPKPAPAPAASPRPQKPRRFGVPGTDMERRLVRKVEPAYPPEAIKAGIQGDVIFETVIGTDGHVKSARPVSGDPLLRATAQAAVMQYEYGTQASEIGSTATVVFRLPARGAAIETPAVLVYKRDPEYPKMAEQMGQRGVVELVATIGTDGRVKAVKVLKGPPMLQKAAQDAVMQWVYKPTLRNGVAVENETHISINFPAQDAVPPASPTGQFSPAVLVYKRDPEYPKKAQEAGERGVVVLVATIGVDGKVKSVKALKGPPTLLQAAEEAVMQWVYKPTMLNGVPVENETHISINFASARFNTATSEPPAAETAPPAQPAPQEAKAAAGRIGPAVLVYKRDPEYPKQAQQIGQRGVVELVATIGSDGRVTDVKMIKGPPLLQEAAVEAVKQWRYKPALVDGVAVEIQTHISINFSSLK